MIPIPNVPDEVHKELKIRAARAGMSLSDYLRLELERVVETPTRDEILQRLAELPPVELSPEPSELLRAERDRR